MTRRFTVSLPDRLGRLFDSWLRAHRYPNRSEGVRDLVRSALVEEEWRAGGETFATITLVYDHHVRELQTRLTEIQHDEATSIVSTLHVHVDHHNCLEVLVVRGDAARIRRLSDRLVGAKGVKFGRLTAATTGRRLA